MVSLSIGSAFILLWIDWTFQESFSYIVPWLRLEASSTRLLLATIVGGMTTIVSLVFSLTILTLSIATSQFGPRLLRTFVSSSMTQFALGTFVASAVYCLLLLATVRGDVDYQLTPYTSLLLAVFWAVFNLCFLIVFVHAIAEALQAPNVVARVARDLLRSIDLNYPDCLSEESLVQQVDIPEGWCESDRCTVCASKEGYVQGIDFKSLLALAKSKDICVRILFKPGQFVAVGEALIEIRPACETDSEISDAVHGCFVMGSRRTPRQDVECAVSELVEVAVRALSPGINDPFTAINCVDHLGAMLRRLAGRALRPSVYRDDEGAIRLLVAVDIFGDILNSAFDLIRQNSGAQPAVLIRLLESLETIASGAVRPSDKRAILRQMEMIAREAGESIEERNDAVDLDKRVELLRVRLLES